MTLDDDVRAELRELEALHRLRLPRVLDGPQGPIAVVDGSEVINLGSNDYLGLAGDPRVRQAAVAALHEDGVGAGASRLVVGNHRRHVALEQGVAEWMRCDGVRLFNTGYAANVGVLTTLLRPGDVVFSDALNHASIIDGCRLSRAQIVIFPHLDLEALDVSLHRYRGRRRIVVSESLFSMDGDLVDAVALDALCRRHGAALMLDEAHAIGARGPEGRGVAAAAGVQPDITLGTFGKALGTFGAFVATSRSIADLLWNRARSLVFSTGLPPSIAAASLRSIEIVRGPEGEQRRQTLAGHAKQLRRLVPELGGAVDGAIAPFVVGDDREAMRWSRSLFEQRVFVQGIRPPTVPEGTARLRASVSAAHSNQQIETAGLAFRMASGRDDGAAGRGAAGKSGTAGC